MVWKFNITILGDSLECVQFSLRTCVMGATPMVYMYTERLICALQQRLNAYKGELDYLWQKKNIIGRIKAAIRSKTVILLLTVAIIVGGGFMLFSCFVVWSLVPFIV